MTEEVHSLFRDAMASLASGVAVITARREDGSPCGLAATSLTSYSAEPPSVLVSIGMTSRCHDALVRAEHFGVHILAAEQEVLARTFAGRGNDKFAGVDWRWDGDVPAIEGAIAYLRCRRTAMFAHHDHSILIGEVLDGAFRDGDPLVYMGRSMGWRLLDS